jgi:peptidoglycan/LPS O-acetylase OafA/YrhL
LGFLRFILALIVITGHAGGFSFGSFRLGSFGAREAVACFFVISGFYMALVLNTKYKEKSLLKVFYINRFLRLWPAYIVVFILSIIFLNESTNIWLRIKDGAFLPTAAIIFSNVFILGTDLFWLFSYHKETASFVFEPAFINAASNGHELLLNPPVFSISIEIMFYLIAPFFVKSLKRSLVVLYLGIIYHFALVSFNYVNIISQYHLFPASLIYFALGACVYHLYAQEIKLSVTQYAGICITGTIMLFLPLLVPGVLLLAFAFAIPFLFSVFKNNAADRFIGELSYPLYIVHYPVLMYLWQNPGWGMHIGNTTAIASIVLACIIYLCIDKPVDRWRHSMVKQKS